MTNGIANRLRRIADHRSDSPDPLLGILNKKFRTGPHRRLR